MRLIALATLCAISCFAGPRRAEILWDQYGVPHIFAHDRTSMFYAEGWAQMRGQASLLLRLYGESRGRAAEYWGPSHLELDRWVQLNGVPELAQKWYAAQDPTFGLVAPNGEATILQGPRTPDMRHKVGDAFAGSE